MAVTIERGGLKSGTQINAPQPQITPEEPSSFLDIPRHITRTGARAYETFKGLPGSLGSTIQSALGYLTRREVPERVQTSSLLTPIFGPLAQPFVQSAAQGIKSLTGRDLLPTELPTIQDVRERETEPLFGKEYIKAQTFPEEVIDTTIQNLPLTYALGAGSFGTKLLQDIFGTTASKAAEQLGTGPVGQIAAGLGGAALGRKVSGSNLLRNFFQQGGTPAKLNELAKTAEEQYWQRSKELGAPIKADARKYMRELINLHDEIADSGAFKTDAQQNDLLKRLGRYVKDVETGEVTAGKLSDRIREINRVLPQFQGFKDKTAREYIQRIQKTMFEEAEKIGKDHPAWFKTWENARDVTRAVNFKPELLSIFDDFPKVAKTVSSPLLYQILGVGTGGLLGGLGGAALGGLTAAGATKSAQALNFASKPVTAKLLGQAFKNVVERNIPQLTRTLTQLNKEAEKFEDELPVGQRINKSRARIEKGGLKPIARS